MRWVVSFGLIACGEEPGPVDSDTEVPADTDVPTPVPPPEPGPPDGDQDGVPDTEDGCPSTPAGQIVATEGLATGCAVLPDTPLESIPPGAWTVLCRRALADEQVLDCGDFSVQPPTLAECVDGQVWGPGCTFGQWEACEAFEFTDPCEPDVFELPEACDALGACLP